MGADTRAAGVPGYSPYRWLLLVAASLAIISVQISMVAYAPILAEIAGDLGIELSTATNLMMAFVLASAFVLLWGGTICDKYGVPRALIVGLALCVLPAVLMPVIGKSYGAVFAARLVQGAPLGIVLTVIGPIVALWFPRKEQGLAGGLMIACMSAGAAIGVAVSPAIFAALGSWQATVAVLSIPGWLGIILAAAMMFTKSAPVMPPGPPPVRDAPRASGYAAVFRNPMTWIAVLIMICNSWGVYILVNLMPTYLAVPEGVGLGPQAAGNIAMTVNIVGIIAPILGGILLDRVFRGRIRIPVILGFALTGIMIYLSLQSGVTSSTGLLVVVLMLAGFGLPFMNPAISMFVATSYPPMVAGRAFGLIFGIGTFFGALGLYLGGNAVGATGSFFWAIMPVTIAAIVGLVAGFFFKSTQDAPTLQPRVAETAGIK